MTRAILALATVSVLFGQQPAKQVIAFTVTDPLNRFVLGLDRDSFEIIAAGARVPIASFVEADSRIAIAVVSDRSVGGSVIQAPSIAEALTQLAASSSPRKGLVIAKSTDTTAIAAGIQVLRVESSAIEKAVVELRNQYVVQFESASANFDLVVKQLRGLPALRANRN
ncbi:MAG: hypothetical protein FJW32_04900 [Acidobacteria bacterium]|nr:hypothetical protein [Acidobacteriota bacterium]